ncbi:hypothetical protein BaRGS_00018544 [Batillaria attramentaria]|uniref:Uncharacterized protein n=1 Tax=Batillaria attramentaria TaxID=370345 RepID=A0ABD0KSK0_9CAEN
MLGFKHLLIVGSAGDVASHASVTLVNPPARNILLKRNISPLINTNNSSAVLVVSMPTSFRQSCMPTSPVPTLAVSRRYKVFEIHPPDNSTETQPSPNPGHIDTFTLL